MTNSELVRIATLEALVNDFVDDESCYFDHHGYCQAHGWFATEPACPHARAKKLLAHPPTGVTPYNYTSIDEVVARLIAMTDGERRQVAAKVAQQAPELALDLAGDINELLNKSVV